MEGAESYPLALHIHQSRGKEGAEPGYSQHHHWCCCKPLLCSSVPRRFSFWRSFSCSHLYQPPNRYRRFAPLNQTPLSFWTSRHVNKKTLLEKSTQIIFFYLHDITRYPQNLSSSVHIFLHKHFAKPLPVASTWRFSFQGHTGRSNHLLHTWDPAH